MSSGSDSKQSKSFWSGFNKSGLTKDDGSKLPAALLEMFPNKPLNELRLYYYRFNGNVPKLIDYFGKYNDINHSFNIANDNLDEIPMNVLIDSLYIDKPESDNDSDTHIKNECNKSGWFDELSNDVIIHNIFPHLDIFIIGKLSILNHHFYNICHKMFLGKKSYDFTKYFDTSSKYKRKNTNDNKDNNNNDNNNDNTSNGNKIKNSKKIDGYFMSFANIFPNLKFFQLRNVLFSDNSFNQIFNKQLLCKNSLKILNLSNCKNLGDNSISNICDIFLNLEELNVSKTSITDESMEYMSHYLPKQLKTLYLNECTKVTDYGITLLLKHQSSTLETLFWRFGNCKSSSSFKFNFESRQTQYHKHLKYLDLYGSQKMVHFNNINTGKFIIQRNSTNTNTKTDTDTDTKATTDIDSNTKINNGFSINNDRNNNRYFCFLTINLSNCIRLETINCSIFYLHEINVSQCKNLRQLILKDCQMIQSINCSKCVKLSKIYLPDSDCVRILNFAKCSLLDLKCLFDETNFFYKSLFNGHLFCLNMSLMNQLNDDTIEMILNLNEKYLSSFQLDTKNVLNRIQHVTDYQLAQRQQRQAAGASSLSSLSCSLSSLASVDSILTADSSRSSLMSLKGETLSANSSYISINSDGKQEDFMPVLSGLCEFSIDSCQNVDQTFHKLIQEKFLKPKSRSKRKSKRRFKKKGTN